ncbi:MAG TPA: glyoxalase superfamily protein [Candidatus Kapabacteria bacterium]|nr:glyoxalase superfamily protein [Candidatus Kapabacteria bacterium]
MSFAFKSPIPILRMFSIEKAKEFYIEYLGFKIDWEHRFEEGLPLYIQVSRGDVVLHLSEHHGDGVPGSALFIPTTNLEQFHSELQEKHYKYLNPCILDQDWGMKEMHVIDPFGNRLRFAERIG